MIGIYNYTVILTYLSLTSAVTGVVLVYQDRPVLAIIALMFSGFCDLFDGKVARTKVRDAKEIQFGIEIDSLTDVIAFGLLPAFIGYQLISKDATRYYWMPIIVLYVVLAVARLAYFNVGALSKVEKDETCSKEFTGLPVTTSALLFPFLFLIKPYIGSAFKYVYLIVLGLVAILFVSKFKMKKPGKKLTAFYAILGIVIILVMILIYKK